MTTEPVGHDKQAERQRLLARQGHGELEGQAGVFVSFSD
jgi:hypothetical protein